MLLCTQYAIASHLTGIDTTAQKAADAVPVGNLNEKAISSLNSQYSDINQQLDKQTSQYLNRLQKREEKLKQKLQGIDSVKAKQLFSNTTQYYAGLQQKLQSPTQKLKQYIPGLDSISTATKFLQQANLSNLSSSQLSQIQGLNSSASALENKLQAATAIKQLLQAREQDLKAQLSQYSSLGGDLTGMNKEVYYYQQQLNEYKDMLHDTKKMEDKALSLVRELPAFKDFMAKNSFLARLFPAPAGAGTTGAASQALAGLQTRASVQQMLTQQLGGAASTAGGAAGGGVNPQQYIQQQMQQAQSQLDQLKDKVAKAGGSSSDMEMPNFTPNGQKTKSFLKRLEYGINIQSQRPNGLLPVTSNLAATVGYKLSDKSTIGVGMSYMLGWGDGLRNISLSSQGIGLRSYMDVKLKGSIWISGGYEQNYTPSLPEKLSLAGFSDIPGAAWQKSGLIGLTKKMKIGKKTSNMQLLWDFLSYSQTPPTPAIKFRVGYTF